MRQSTLELPDNLATESEHNAREQNISVEQWLVDCIQRGNQELDKETSLLIEEIIHDNQELYRRLAG